jgi:V-type H+-transporting ATPase subunit a
MFQLIVNTYGFPRYQEVNPGLFTVIMFPFLFGVMFGDIMHGGLLFLFAIYLVKNYPNLKDKNHPLEPFLPMRFLLILMGFFAFFSGFIYNDFASIPFNLFGSCY